MEHSHSRRKQVRLVTFLAAGLFVMCGLAVRLGLRNISYQRALGMSYARAFSALAESVEKMDTSLEKSVYVTSPELIAQLCTEIYSEARTAQQAVGELPYGSVELEQTAAFAARVGDYAQAVGRSAARSGGYTGDQLETITRLKKLTTGLVQQLDELESRLYEGSMTLQSAEEIEKRLSSLTEEGNALAGSSYEELESDFPELPTLIYDGPFSDHLRSRKRAVLEGEKTVTMEQARKDAADFLGMEARELTQGDEVEGEVPCYRFGFGETGSIEMTKQGGYVLSITDGREIHAAKLTHGQGAALAKKYLEDHDITDMKESYFIDYGNRLTVNFAASQGEVICYPDLIKVEVALDDGSIVGFESEGYLSNHIRRELEPTVTQEEARQQVSPQLDVQECQLALIPTEGKHEVLCWEFRCKNKEGRHYLAYINAQTGKEQQLLILIEDEKGSLTM